MIGSRLHDAWRAPKQLLDGTFTPTWRGLNGEKNLRDVTPEMAEEMGLPKSAVIDIANSSFDQLNTHWQGENLAAGQFVAQFYPQLKKNPELIHDEKFVHDAASQIHDAWGQRNPWEALATVPFDDLDPVEQEKDIAHLEMLSQMTEQIRSGEIDLDTAEEQFGLIDSRETISVEAIEE